jgi:O-antigen/teichoic acid export membrane protein
MPGSRGAREETADSIRRNAAYGLGVRLSGALLTGILTLFLVRALEPDGYGVFILAVSVGTIVILASDFGISISASRFVAERRGDDRAVAGILSDALSLKIAASLLVSIALFALASPIAGAYGNDDLVWPLRLVAVAILGQSVMLLFAQAFEGLGRTSLGFRLAFSESTLETGASIALVLLGTGVVGATAGRAIGFLFGGLLGFVLARRLLGSGELRVATKPRWGYRPILTYAGALVVIDGAFALYTEIDTLLIGAILGTTAAGLFAAPLKLLIFTQYPALALAAGVAPRLARHEDHAPRVGAFRTALRFLVIAQFAIAVPLLAWPEPIVDLLLGSDYGDSVEVMRLLAPYVAIGGIAPLLAIGINYMGEARRRVWLAVATVALNAILDLILINSIGIEGAAIATDVAITFYVAGHLWVGARLIDLELGRLALTTMRALAAAAAMAGVLFALGTDSLSAPEIAAGAILAPIAYALVLVGTGEFSRRELRWGLNAVRNVVLPTAPAPAPAATAEHVASVRALPGFLIRHAAHGSGFEIERTGSPGEGRFRALCLGCGQSLAYSAATSERERLDRSGAEPGPESPPRPAPPRPAPAGPPPRSRSRRAWILALAALAAAAIAAAIALLWPGGDDDPDPAPRPGTTTTTTTTATEPPAESGTAEINNGAYTLELPAGWRESAIPGGTLYRPRVGDAAAVEVYVAREPGLDLRRMAIETSELVARRFPEGSIAGARATDIGGEPGYRLRGGYRGGEVEAFVVADGPRRLLLLKRIDSGAPSAIEDEADAVARSFGLVKAAG